MNKKNRPAKTQGSPKTKLPYFNNANVQRARILSHFKETPRATTFDFRKIGVMHPAGRIMELRRQGYRIDLHWVYENDSNGVEHRIGQYIFQGRRRNRHG